MTAIWITARAEWRQRWRSFLLLALLAGLAGGVTLAAFTGSRRADTSFDRLLEREKYPNVSVELDERPDPELVRAAARLPGVEIARHRAMLAVAPADSGMVVGRDTIAAAIPVAAGDESAELGIVEGRPYDEHRADELVVNETMRDSLHADVGDRVSLVSLTPSQGAAIEETGGSYPSPEGPTTEVTLVGVARGAEDVSDAPEPILIVSPAYYERYGAEIAHGEGVDLRVDKDHLAGIEDRLHSLFGDDAEVGPADDIAASIEDGLAVDVNGLRVFAAAAAVAGLVALGQALVRQAETMSVQHPTRLALGMTSRQLILAGVTTLAPVAAAGALLAAAVAVAGGPLAVTGLARQAEPDPGPWFDAAVPYGAILVALLVLGLAAGAFALAGTRRHTEERVAARVSRRTEACSALPVPVGLGVRMALDTGRGPAALPSLPSLVGAAVGVAGVVAALAVGARVDDLLATPKLWGADYDATVVTGAGMPSDERAAELLAGVPEVDAVAVFESLNVPVFASHRTDMVGAATVWPHRGTIAPVLPEGRAPVAPDEVALGDGVLKRLDVEVGGTVEVERHGERVVLRVVGTFLRPGVDDASSGMLVTPQGFEGLEGEDDGGGALVRFAPDVDQDVALDRLRALGARVDVTPAGEEVPSNVDNLDELGALPAVLASFLALLAVIATVHGLVSTTRRRRHDLAVLRVLGFVGGQVRSTLRWQALTVAGVGLIVGVPAGVIAGRRIWSALAEAVGVVDDWSLPWLTVVIAATAALAVAVLLAIPPGRAAARMAPGRVLRSE